ncbi:MAG: Gfo/Idh/MocA family protein [Armatimonadota bacterium]
MQSLNRRRFLRQSGKAAAGVAAGLTILRERKSAFSANDQVNVAVCGINGRGKSHMNAMCGIDGVRVIGLCDPDTRLFESRSKMIEDKQGHKPKCYADIRDLLANDDLDAITVATCDHWHALATIWACQAGKDVYVEKPASWCVFESQKIYEAARKYGRMVQVGTQSRSKSSTRSAIARLWAGELGDVYMARALCYKPRGSIGYKPIEDPPEGLNWDVWVGPAPMQPYHANLVHYKWHWFWDFGTTDMGNQGSHEMDIAMWGLNKTLPVRISGVGGRFAYEDQAETPNTQVTTFQYDDGKLLVFEVRGHYTHDETGVKVGNMFYGSEGWMHKDDDYKPHLGRKGEVKEIEYAEGELPPVGGSGEGDNFENWISAVRSRRRQDLNADIRGGALSAALCHLGNVSCRLGRELRFDPDTMQCIGDDEANKYMTRPYREPYVVPDEV